MNISEKDTLAAVGGLYLTNIKLSEENAALKQALNEALSTTQPEPKDPEA
jgi:hypothetical protein